MKTFGSPLKMPGSPASGLRWDGVSGSTDDAFFLDSSYSAYRKRNQSENDDIPEEPGKVLIIYIIDRINNIIEMSVSCDHNSHFND